MIKLFIALLSGLLFGAGLAASDMNNPERVQGFLDSRLSNYIKKSQYSGLGKTLLFTFKQSH